jgi:hypothetical protein
MPIGTVGTSTDDYDVMTQSLLGGCPAGATLEASCTTHKGCTTPIHVLTVTQDSASNLVQVAPTRSACSHIVHLPVHHVGQRQQVEACVATCSHLFASCCVQQASLLSTRAPYPRGRQGVPQLRLLSWGGTRSHLASSMLQQPQQSAMLPLHALHQFQSD